MDRKQNGMVKVITGVRRCGKSYLLFELYYKYLLSSGVKESSVIKITLDNNDFAKLRNPNELAKYVNERINDTDEFYIFIDEIQYCKKIPNPSLEGDYITFYDVLNGFLYKKNLDVYITGSNSKMLSSDVLTEFRGRGDEVRVYPLSFKEYYSAKGGDKNIALKEYMIFGGMPLVLSRPSAESKITYLKQLFEETYFKDIIERKRIEKDDVLEHLTDCICSSMGSLTNIHNLASTINSVLHNKKESSVSDLTIKAYVDHLKDAFLFSEAKRYDIRGKKYFESQSKFYCVDHGLRNARLNMRQNEESHIMENIIYNDLIQRDCSVDVGVVESFTKDKEGKTKRVIREIDFVVNNGNNQCYIQSAFELSNLDRQVAELKPFSMINNSFKKIVVTRNEMMPWYDDNGIYHIGLIDFLLRHETI
ncbi:MAG: ATP-binding protein [Sphaerochaetaceae bacterium]|nr:ATP-binding protein [Sphaerochaetaceae bacterium]